MRKTTILCASVALAAGVLCPSAEASTGTPALLALTPGATEVHAVNLGAQIKAPTTASTAGFSGSLAQRLADATYCVEVDSDVHALGLMFDSYAPPAGVSIGLPTAFLWYRQDSNTNVHVPSTGWDYLVATPNTSTADDTRSAWKTHLVAGEGDADGANDPVCLTARFPGTYRFHFFDPGHAAGDSDDTESPVVTMVVKDVQLPGTLGSTASALGDDWQPEVSAPIVVGAGKALTAKVDLSWLSLVDSRGSNKATGGVLGGFLADLVGVKFSSPVSKRGDALDRDLRLAGTSPFEDYACFGDPDSTPGGVGTCAEYTAVNGAVHVNSVTVGGVTVPFAGSLGVAGVTLNPVAAAGPVSPQGVRVVPAVTDGEPTIKHVGQIVSWAFLDRTGAGLVDLTPATWSTSTWTRPIYTEPALSAATTTVSNTVASIVTLYAAPTALKGAGKVTVSGIAEDAAVVTVKATDGTVVGTATADPVTGAWSTVVDITKTTTLRASTASGVSAAVTVKVQTVLTGLKVTRHPKNKRYVVAKGTCNPALCKASLRVNGKYIRSGWSSATTGTVKFTQKVGAGKVTVKVTVKAPGTISSSGTAKA